MSETTEPLTTRVLLASLPREIALLVSQTVSLARVECGVAVSELSAAALGLAASAITVLFGVGVLVAAMVLIAIALGAPPWAAALGVGVVLAGGGSLAGWLFFSRLREAPLALPETRGSLLETMTWLKSEVKR
jgi:hypothetical protein